MSIKVLGSSLIVGLLMVIFAGAGAASAATTVGAGALYRANGTAVGGVSLATTDSGLQLTVTLRGAQLNATYTICVTAVVPQEQGSCSATAGTVTTDATGVGTGTIALWTPGPVLLVTVSSSAGSSDYAQAVLDTGLMPAAYPNC